VRDTVAAEVHHDVVNPSLGSRARCGIPGHVLKAGGIVCVRDCTCPHGALAGATMTLRVTDLSDWRERLIRGGATILGTSDNPWGRLLVFEELDGNVVKLMQPPAWSNAAG